MRSRPDLLRCAFVAGVLACGIAPAQAAQAGRPAGMRVERPGPEEIARAIEAVRQDPNLGSESTIKTLQWKSSGQPRTSSSQWAGLRWIAGLFGWLEQSARLLVWGAALLLAGFAAAFVARLAGKRAGSSGDPAFVAPTHVRDLDIRPETLPADIGAAARALWDRGEQRAALALLYRGMLSRLAHVHRIAIRDSSTEGDCLALAAGHLAPHRHAYASGLIAVWQRAVYGRQDVDPAAVHALCAGFAPALDSAARTSGLETAR